MIRNKNSKGLVFFKYLACFVYRMFMSQRIVSKINHYEARRVKNILRTIEESWVFYNWIDIKCKTKPCFFRLFMSGQEDYLQEL